MSPLFARSISLDIVDNPLKQELSVHALMFFLNYLMPIEKIRSDYFAFHLN